MRGTLLSAVIALSVSRLIPARAGNALLFAPLVVGLLGSSPRVRERGISEGRLVPVAAVHPRACGERTCIGREEPMDGRFIPARAGNASVALTNRVCFTGSSPRVRGTRPRVDARGLWAVHPRACGERESWVIGWSDRRRFIPARANAAAALAPGWGLRHSGRELRHTAEAFD